MLKNGAIVLLVIGDFDEALLANADRKFMTFQWKRTGLGGTAGTHRSAAFSKEICKSGFSAHVKRDTAVFY